MTLFGTDGIRGPAGEEPLTPASVLRLGQVTAFLLKHSPTSFHVAAPPWFSELHPLRRKNIIGEGRVLVGRDTRASGPEIEDALTRGLMDFGVESILAGVIPTPGVAQLTRRWGCALGAVISASHNPASDNGIKLFSPQGLKIPDEAEAEIDRVFHGCDFSPKIRHSVTRRAAKPRDVSGRRDDYLDLLRAALDPDLSLRGMRVVVDCAHGAASSFASRLLDSLGVQVTVLNNLPDGSNINRDCGATRPKHLAAQTGREKADLGAAFDGDADRAILADETGRIVDGDHLLAMHALDRQGRGALPGKTIVGTAMTNHALAKLLEGHGLRLLRAPVGDRFVLEEMLRGGFWLGGEPSGHLIFLDAATAGDGMLTVLQTLALMKRTGRPLSGLASILRKFPQILLNVRVAEKPPLEELASLQAACRRAEAVLSGSGRVVLRYSGTEPLCRVMVEGPDEKVVHALAKEIAGAVRSSVGTRPHGTRTGMQL